MSDIRLEATWLALERLHMRDRAEVAFGALSAGEVSKSRVVHVIPKRFRVSDPGLIEKQCAGFLLAPKRSGP